jgi:IclR family transcriptional regulator, acetate operon repressor
MGMSERAPSAAASSTLDRRGAGVGPTPEPAKATLREVVAGRTVVSKAVAILMTYLYGESKTFTEIVAATGLPLSTVHRLLWELTACRILERTELGRYRVAPALRHIAAVARGPVAGLESRAALVLHDLSQTLDTEVRFGVLRTPRVAYIEKGRGRQPVTTFGDGATADVHTSAMGLVLLAFSPRPVVDVALLRACTAAGVAVDRIERTLHRVRLRHLAVTWDDREPARSALAVPVFRAGGVIVAALEAQVHDPSAQLPFVRPALVIAARSLSRELSLPAGRGAADGALDGRPRHQRPTT